MTRPETMQSHARWPDGHRVSVFDDRTAARTFWVGFVAIVGGFWLSGSTLGGSSRAVWPAAGSLVAASGLAAWSRVRLTDLADSGGLLRMPRYRDGRIVHTTADAPAAAAQFVATALTLAAAWMLGHAGIPTAVGGIAASWAATAAVLSGAALTTVASIRARRILSIQ